MNALNKKNYISPEIEVSLLERLNLLLNASAELPDGMEESDGSTFGEATAEGV